MNTTKTVAIATLIFLGANSAGAANTPAWMDEGFVMEEVVVTASLRDVRIERLARLRSLRLALLDRS